MADRIAGVNYIEYRRYEWNPNLIAAYADECGCLGDLVTLNKKGLRIEIEYLKEAIKELESFLEGMADTE